MQRHLGSQLVTVLVGQVRIFYGTFHVLTNIEWCTRQVAVPPMDEFVVVGSLVANLPIQLGHAVVHPAVGIPQKHVGIQLVVVLQAVGTTAIGIALLVTIDAERRHAELHPGLCLMNGFIDLLDEQVDIIATPIVTILHTVRISTILCIVRYLHTCYRIGIEIVVDMQAVNIVTLNDVTNDVTDIVATLLQGRIEQRQTIILEGPLRMAHNDMIGCILMG